MTTRTRWLIGLVIAALALAALLAACGDDEDDDSGDNGDEAAPAAEVARFEADGIAVLDPWVRASIPMTLPEDEEPIDEAGGANLTTAAFMTIENTGEDDERLIGASVAPEIAAMVEIHETITTDEDVMQMQPVSGIDIPAGESVTLAPRGLHIMLMNLGQDLDEGETVEITLEFESGTTLAVKAEVRPLVPME